jgi:hypothetical protein
MVVITITNRRSLVFEDMVSHNSLSGARQEQQNSSVPVHSSLIKYYTMHMNMREHGIAQS